MTRSPVAFATLGGERDFGNPIHHAEADSLIFHTRYVACFAEFAGSKPSNARLGGRHRLPFTPGTQCNGDGDCLVLDPLLSFAHDQSLHKRSN